MHWLRGEASPEGRRLLRVLLIWLGTLSTDPGRAFRRDRSGFLLRGLRRGQRFRPIVTRLAWQCPYQRVGMVGASRSHACCVVSRRAGSRRRLDGYAHLDGFGLHLKCETVRTHALPLHRALLPHDDRAGDRSWHHFVWQLRVDSALGVVIIGGSKLIWWATERARGKFS